jgi:hypothetical protein
VNTEPLPGSLVTVTSPPIMRASEELRLVLARQLELAALVLDFVEQPHVLDGDRRLVSEC